MGRAPRVAYRSLVGHDSTRRLYFSRMSFLVSLNVPASMRQK